MRHSPFSPVCCRHALELRRPLQTPPPAAPGPNACRHPPRRVPPILSFSLIFFSSVLVQFSGDRSCFQGRRFGVLSFALAGLLAEAWRERAELRFSTTALFLKLFFCIGRSRAVGSVSACVDWRTRCLRERHTRSGIFGGAGVDALFSGGDTVEIGVSASDTPKIRFDFENSS